MAKAALCRNVRPALRLDTEPGSLFRANGCVRAERLAVPAQSGTASGLQEREPTVQLLQMEARLDGADATSALA